MRLEYEITKKDYIDAVYYKIKKSKLFTVVTVLVFIVYMFLFLYSKGSIIVAVSLLATIIIVNANRFNARRAVDYQIKSGGLDREYFGRHILEMGGDIRLQYGDVHKEMLYSGIQKIESSPAGIEILVKGAGGIFIPQSAFDSEEQREAFINYVQSETERAKDIESAVCRDKAQEEQSAYIMEYTHNEADFVDAMVKANRVLFCTRQGWTNRRIILLIINILCLVAIVLGGLGNIIAMIFVLFVCLTQMRLIIAFAVPISKRMLINDIAKGIVSRDYFDKQILYIKQDRLTISYRHTVNEIMFDRIHCIKQDDDNIYIILKGGMIGTIPGRAFESEDKKREIIRFINEQRNQGMYGI